MVGVAESPAAEQWQDDNASLCIYCVCLLLASLWILFCFVTVMKILKISKVACAQK